MGQEQDGQRKEIIQLQLVVDVLRDRGRAVSAARAWFERGWRELGWELWEVADAQRTGDQRRAGLLGPYGVEAGMGFLDLAEDLDLEDTEEDWRVFLRILGQLPEAFFGAAQRLWSEFMEAPRAVVNHEKSDYLFSIDAARRYDPDRRFLVLTIDAAKTVLYASPEREQALLRFFRSVADLADPVFGIVEFGYGTPMTGLEYVLYQHPWNTIPQSRETLRGYSYVTVICEDMAARLGGAAALADSGAFHLVERLGAGGYWLQATPSLADYGPSEAERVFAVLRPLLPPGAYATTFRNEWRQP